MFNCKWNAACAGILMLAMAPLAEAAPPKPPKSGSATYSGQATVLRADVLGITTVLSDTGALPPTGGALETSLLTASVLGLVNVNVLHAATIGQGDRSRSEASVADLNLTVAGITIGAGFVMSRAMAACGGVSGSSEIVGLVINGQAIVVSGQPNQTVNLLLGKVVINEQTSGPGTMTVNALHVVVNGIADVVVSSAHADITCQGAPPCSGRDFVTGGGWITGSPSGAKSNFGVAGGTKQKGLWGHLTYLDHGTGMKVKGTGVTAYVIVDATTRHIEGNAEINGQGGFTYQVDVSDNGEPGRDDIFTIRLSNGYFASGRLVGGNIQLHQPCK